MSCRIPNGGASPKHQQQKKRRRRTHGPPLPAAIWRLMFQLVQQFNKVNGCTEETLRTVLIQLVQEYGIDFLKLFDEVNKHCEEFTGSDKWLCFLLKDGKPVKPMEREDRLVLHNAWQKQGVLTRHSKIFALKILNNLVFDPKTHRPLPAIALKFHKDRTVVLKSPATCVVPSDDSNEKLDNLGKCAESSPSDDVCSCSDKYDGFDTDELKEALGLVKPGSGDSIRPNTDVQVYVVAEYPDSSNSHVAQSVLRAVDVMSPREFLTYIFEELSLEERESLLMDEKQRRKTFLVNWPHDNNLSGEKMAQSGFYCVGSSDRVQCVFCRGSLQKWNQQDVVMSEHAKHFPFCRFTKGLPCGNREYIDESMTAEDLRNITFLTAMGKRKNRDGTFTIDCSLLGICTTKAHMLKFAIRSARMRTFARWPGRNVMEPEHLCDAGFYYTGFQDSTRCFFCSLTLKDWKRGDDAFEEHARWLPECLHLVHTKGEVFVNSVLARTPENKKRKSESMAAKKNVQKKKGILKSVKQGMIDTCVKLGHDLGIVKMALDINGGPFNCVEDMLSAIYVIKEGDIAATQAQTDHVNGMEVDVGQSTAQAEVISEKATLAHPPGGNCITCFNNAGHLSPANHIGLPCGHMLYCEKCNQEEASKSSDAAYKHKCVFKGCGAPLNATFKTYRI